MSTDLGIDLGSYRTVIYSGKSAVLDEHTAISYETHTGRLIAAGTDAFQMIDRTPRSITSVCPVKNGRIAEYDLAESMLAAFVKSVSRASMLKSRIIAAVPSDLEEMPKRAFYNICYAAGARDVCLIESPVAAAIGLETDFTTPKGTFIVDIGSGTTDIAALSLGGLVKSESIPIAGSDFRSAIENYVKRLEKLEEITNSFPGIANSYAIQAGREIRVMVDPEKVSEDTMIMLARDIAKKIEAELTYPGQIKVNVLRETKAVDYAK